jgi:HAE1 family hydrophobic/amphiphilic exporter-1
LRTLVGGDDQVTTFREGDDRYDVELRLKKEFRDTPTSLDRLYVPSGSLGNVRVSSVATLEQAGGPSQIERVNRQRQILLLANLVDGQALSNVLPIIDRRCGRSTCRPYARPERWGGPRVRTRGGHVIAFLLSIVFMYMVLAAQLRASPTR